MEYEEIYSRVIKVVKNYEKFPENASLTSKSNFAIDLGFDAADIIDLVLEFEKEFNIEIPDRSLGKVDSILGAAKQIAKVIW